MVTKCIIKFCNTIKSGDGVTLHRLPSNADMQKEWFRAILNETGQTVFSEDDVICSKHFDPSCFTAIDGNQVLKPTAVPFESTKIEGPEAKRIKREKDNDKPVRCSVFNCENSLETTAATRPELLYYPFPKKTEIAESWRVFCNREDYDQEKCNYVCSDHFTGDAFNQKRTRAKILKVDAVPTIYKTEALTEEVLENGTEHPGAQLTGATTSKVFSTSSQSPSTPAEVSSVSVPATTISNSEMPRPSCPSENRLCAILNCPSSNKAVATDLYPIPGQLNIRKKWLKIIETHTTQNDLPNTAVVCSLHFAQNCFKIDKENKKVLLTHAVPSIFPTPKIEKGDFPVMKPSDFNDPKRGKEFYEWSLKNYQEQRTKIKLFKDQAKLQSKRIARLAKSIDDFKAKRFVSEDANNALQNLFDKIIDAQYDII